MADPTFARIESSLRMQQQALSELIEIALLAVKESTDSSVSTMHLNTRLMALAESLKGLAPKSSPSTVVRPRTLKPRRTI